MLIGLAQRSARHPRSWSQLVHGLVAGGGEKVFTAHGLPFTTSSSSNVSRKQYIYRLQHPLLQMFRENNTLYTLYFWYYN
jgi:hypothetical protein